MLVAGCGDSKIVLETKGEVALYESAEDAYNQRDQIGTLPRSTRVLVTDCVDLKSAFPMQIKDEHGRSGFVLDGDYVLSETPTCHSSVLWFLGE
jgi:hypothetical protein